MINNSILDKLRATLTLSDADVLECFALAGCTLSPELEASLEAQDQEGTQTPLSDALLADFLDGLILVWRGPSPSGSLRPAAAVELTNNMILKKLRIALDLYAEEMLELFQLGGKTLSNADLTALFRKPTHKRYKPCDDELLSAFLEGVEKSEKYPR